LNFLGVSGQKEARLMNSNLIEAANRAEATALLIRSGYRVYRPEADFEGEDLVVRTPSGDLVAVQLKGRAYVGYARYGQRNLWMLFPSASFKSEARRQWYLVPHDDLFAYIKDRHGHAPGWNNAWSYPSIPKHLVEFLSRYEIRPKPLKNEEAVTE
jgi:hypothetical protein